MGKISPDTGMKELLARHPEAAKALARHGMMCPGCGGAEAELLRHAAKNHGVPLEDLIREIEAAIDSSK